MKCLPSVVALGLLTLTLPAENPAPADAKNDPFVKNAGALTAPLSDSDWKQCVVTYEAYAVDRTEAAALLDSEHGSAARYRRILELATAGKARLEILEMLTTKSGQRAVIESIDEVRYPTEFADPETAKGQAAPTAWETRNVGDTFELEPVIGPDGRVCDLNLVPQRVNLTEFRDLPDLPGALKISQPIFNTQKITTSTTLLDGEPQYLGTMTPATPAGATKDADASEIWLAFLHVKVQSPPPAKPQPEAKLKAAAPNLDGEVPLPIELQYSCYSLDRATAREILVPSAPMNAPGEKVKALVAENKARLEHISTIKTKSGQRAIVEEIQEVRYATEYSPEHRVATTETTHRTVQNQVGEKKPDTKGDKKDDSTSTSTETITTTKADANSELIPASAKAFETRNVGVTVEVEPVANGTFVDLNHVIQSVKMTGNLKVAGIAVHYPPQPLFETSKVTTSESVPLDLPILVSTLNPPGADGVNGRTDSGRTYLLFVRATLGEP